MLPAVLSLVGCSSEQTRTTPSPETVRNIPVLAVQQANVPDLLEAVGTRTCRPDQRRRQPNDGEHRRDPRSRRRPRSARSSARRNRRLPAASRCRPRDCSRPCRPTATGRSRFRPGAGGINVEALPNPLRKEIGESAGVRRGESPSTSGSRASRHGKGWPSPGAGSVEPGTHVSGLHADSGAVRRRGDGEESRFRHAGFAGHADLHRRGCAPLSTGSHRQRERSSVCTNRTSRYRL